jgi:hypothetical protein
MQKSSKLWKEPEKKDIRLQWNDHAKYNCICDATGWTINRGDPIYYDKLNKKIYCQKSFCKEQKG